MRLFSRFLLPAVIAAAAFLTAGVARADDMGSVSYTTVGGQSANFTFTYNPTTHEIDSISGTHTIGGDVYNITGLLPGQDGGDETFYSAGSGGPAFSFAGLSFGTEDISSDIQNINLYWNGSSYVDENFTNGTTDDPINSISISYTPEPSSFLLLGTGIMAMAFAFRKRALLLS